ncbi:MAG: multicopper oxidase family protein [Desulfobacteraceae bacterium]|nr:MAG: multicopper oxidase family protein [Desulfobacteraceae bacterium]
MKTIDRRRFIQWAGAFLGSAALSSTGFLRPQALWGANRETGFEPDVEIYLEAGYDQISLLSGPRTDVWRYHGKVLTGPEETLDLSDMSYLGPTFRFRRGQNIRIRFQNLLPDETTIHWHGLHVPDTMDGHPRLAVAPGGSYTFEFKVLNRAGTYWYHPHPHGRTGHQVYGGLAGLLIVSEPQEAALPLPSGRYDLPLIIQDRAFDRENQLLYMPRGMMDRMNGMMGDRMLVNGRPDHFLDMDSATYRLRILNASNARIYRLAWDDGGPLTIIGTDGGLLERPATRQEVLLSPGERIELWADFSRHRGGDVVRLVSRPLPQAAAGGMMMGRGMMGGRMGMMAGRSPLDDTTFTVTTFKVGTAAGPRKDLPGRLRPIERYAREDADNTYSPKRFSLTMSHMQGLINGRVFDMQAVAPDEYVRLDGTEIWEFANDGLGMGMMNMPMAHPMHMHAVQFQVLERWGVSHDGYLDAGWKDTLLILPGERAQVIARFSPYAGLYIYHCHNLEHEDGGMMRNFRIS